MLRNTTSKPIILVVDDTTENIDILVNALSPDYKVRPAPSGAIALKAAQILPHPDLVLLDIMMPEMDGYEVCRRLKSDPKTREIPIIFVTAKSNETDELEGFRLGAMDYISKPYSLPIVLARVKNHIALKTAKRRLEEHNQHLLHEREFIENIVLKMRSADVLDERNVRHLVSPVEQTAGDILLSTFTPDGRQLVLLGDFTGHGLPSAIGGPLVTYILHELASREATGAEIFQAINQQLCARLPTEIFFASTMVEVFPKRDQANLWNAALPDNLLIRQGVLRDRIPSRLLPLGILKNLDIAGATITLPMEKGDRLFVFSDGIIEARSAHGTMFGIERLSDFLQQTAADAAPLEHLICLLEKHVGAADFEDDITLVEIQT